MWGAAFETPLRLPFRLQLVSAGLGGAWVRWARPAVMLRQSLYWRSAALAQTRTCLTNSPLGCNAWSGD